MEKKRFPEWLILFVLAAVAGGLIAMTNEFTKGPIAEQEVRQRVEDCRAVLPAASEFTEKELDVLRIIAMGYTNQEIADELVISVNTVRFHLANLISKTGCNSKIELAILATKSGLVVPNS